MSNLDDESPQPESALAIHSDEEPAFIIGIGASAGGLEALSSLLGRMTLDGAAFIVVQHLAPTQKSSLAEILDRASRLKVVTAEDGALVERNVVYVNPPGVELTLRNGTLQVSVSPADQRAHLPIDSFFRSLAQDRGSRAIGVVLSGTGTDGTFGLAAIKAGGGLTFVQDPLTAKFDGMPRSALESGVSDFCLSPESIADEIVQVSAHPYLRRLALVRSDDEFLVALATLVKKDFGIDLSHYKPNTIERRLHRRMAVHRLERVADYLRLCRSDPKELAAFHRDLLINVTAFFRDGEPFDVLKDQVLARLVERKRESDSIRVWVAGCASGEEAYSIAICLAELLDQSGRQLQVQIFATDVDAEAVQQARRGVYPPNIATDVSPERLQRFFVKTEDGRYQVVRRIRDLVVFSTQNLSRDAPFSRLDLATCRNVLIYLQATIQRKVLRILHYALAPDGVLMLGTSETVGDAADLFSLVDRKNKIYTAKHVALTQTLLDVGVGSVPTMRAAEVSAQGPARTMVSIAHLADRKVLELYAPPGVVINQNLDVIYFRGRTAPYLEQPSGVVTHGILRMVRAELHSPLKTAIERAGASGETTTAEAQIKDANGSFRPLTILVHPLQEPESRASCLLILFQERPIGVEPSPPRASLGPASEQQHSDVVRQLMQELAVTKDYLQSTIEELERTNEDLKAANEELQSANEELQSTNEEHETSKEELQSTNEELVTLNEELHHRMRDLSTSNDDLHNVLLGVDRAVIIVGIDLRIRRFTQAAEKTLHLIPGDIGRSVAHLNSFLGGFGIERRVADAIAQVATSEQEVQATDGRWYILRITPYKTLDLNIRGAVISFADIEVSKRRGELTKAVGDYASEFLAAVQHPLLIVNRELQVIWVNGAFYESFGVLAEEILGTRLANLMGGVGLAEALDSVMLTSFTRGTPFRDVEVLLDRQGSDRKWVSVGGSRIRGVANDAALLLLSIETQTGRLKS